MFIGHDKDECKNLNWKPKIKEFQKLFESWKKRKLTLFGKVHVIYSLAISKFVYNFTIILDVPDDVISEIKTEIYKFLWKKESVKRTNIMG